MSDRPEMPPDIAKIAATPNGKFVQAIVEGMAPEIKAYIERLIAPLKQRIAELEARGIEYRGTYQRALSYRRGALVTNDGSMFAALRNIAEGEMPGKSDGWQLAVKRGKDATERPGAMA